MRSGGVEAFFKLLMQLITETPWAALTRAVKKSPDKCQVAVAYFGQGASKLLPLRKGSVLVLNFSEGNIKSGAVCPAEVLILIKKGVEVHSVENLHAKVFVIGQSAYVGSTNVSKGSAGILIEAVAHAAVSMATEMKGLIFMIF